MTRKQAEQAIYEHMKAIKGIVMEYAPDDIYISLRVHSDDGSIFLTTLIGNSRKSNGLILAILEVIK